MKPQDILVKLLNWQVESNILEDIWELSGLEIEGSLMSVYPDLSVITINRRKNYQFLTTVLRHKRMKYRWGLPFKLVAEYKDCRAVIRVLKRLNNF